MRELLTQVPPDTAAVAVLRIPAEELGKLVLAALGPDISGLVDDLLRGTHVYADTAALLNEIAPVLDDRVAVVVRRQQPDPSIMVMWPRPIPEVACMFWLRPTAGEPLDRFVTMLRKFPFFTHVYRLDVTDSQGIMEFCNPFLPGTGELATYQDVSWFVIANSGPLVKDLILAPKAEHAFATAVAPLAIQGPPEGHGLLMFRTNAVDVMLEQWQTVLMQLTNTPDADWIRAQRPDAERAVVSDLFPKHVSVDELSADAWTALDKLVALRLQQDWAGALGGSRLAFVQEARSLLELFPTGVGQVVFDRQTIDLVLRRLCNIK
jgi:hypothetical protein